MMTEDEKFQIRQCMEALRDQVEGFRARRPQLEMIAAVANTLARCRAEDEKAGNGDHIAVIEAGTGTGKSFGALVPAIVMARARGKRLIVSSSTVALQDQYAEKDAPTLQAVMPMGFTFAVAKGRRRFACTVKMMQEYSAASQEDLALDDAPAQANKREEVATVRFQKSVRELYEGYEAGRWSGDRDELVLPVSEEVWSRLSTDRQGCSGKQCSQFTRCPFYAAKQKVKDADVVIANHDLVLSALTMDAGSVLPAAQDSLYVFDEAHSLAAKVVEHFSEKHALSGAQEWLHGAVDAVRDAVLALSLDRQFMRDAQESARTISQSLHELYDVIKNTRAFDEKKARRFKNGVLPEWVARAGGQILTASSLLNKTFASLREGVLEKAQAEGQLATQVLVSLGFFAGKVENLVATWELMLCDDAEQEAPIARWIERHDEGSSGEDYLVCASPITGGEKLRKLLWNRASGVVLMSATLTSCGTFDLFVRQSGLGVYSGLQFLQVESPFDYRANARLVIPAMRADPSNAQAHTDEVVERMPELVHSLGTLVLFASGKQMRDVFARLPEALQRITLMQGCLPKSEMLNRHKTAVDRGERSVLFGLQSLAEGVDLPREYCTHVVCVKLPFSVPDSPLEEARREWIESQGRSSFIEITVPETAVKLKQQLGRLLRTMDDTGTATILDRRLVSKRWGGLLMRGLPDFDLQVERAGSRPASARA